MAEYTLDDHVTAGSSTSRASSGQEHGSTAIHPAPHSADMGRAAIIFTQRFRREGRGVLRIGDGGRG